MRTVIVIPTYNESDNIEALVAEILALGGDLQIVVVDDNSPDGTGEVVEHLARTNNAVHVIRRPAKLGLGTAHIAGFRRGFALGADRIITMDADFSHHPRYVPQMIELCKTYDVVVGSRYVDGGGTRYVGLPRQLLSRTANACARLVLGLHVRDCTSGFRCYRREVLESIHLDDIFSDGYSFLVEMVCRCWQGGHRIGEVPIIFEDRRQGQSKISRQEIFKAIYTLARLRWEQTFAVPFPKLERRKGESPWNM